MNAATIFKYGEVGLSGLFGGAATAITAHTLPYASGANETRIVVAGALVGAIFLKHAWQESRIGAVVCGAGGLAAGQLLHTYSYLLK